MEQIFTKVQNIWSRTECEPKWLTKECDTYGGLCAEQRGLGHQEVGRVGVEGWYPDKAAPANVVAGPIQRDVQRVEVSCLPPEELADVDSLQYHVDDVANVKNATCDDPFIHIFNSGLPWTSLWLIVRSKLEKNELGIYYRDLIESSLK